MTRPSFPSDTPPPSPFTCRAAIPASRLQPLAGTLIVLLVAAVWVALGTAFSARSAGAPTSLPTVELADEPLHINGARAKPSVVLALSTEVSIVGATYRDEFDPQREYLGYFDPNGCYRYEPGPREFNWTVAATGRRCGGAGFSGNFMNWATSSAVDILRYGLTGGDRVVDDRLGTTVQRAVLPKGFYNHPLWFPSKRLPAALAGDVLPSHFTGGAGGAGGAGGDRGDRGDRGYSDYSGDIYIANCLNRVYFGTAATGSCDAPGLNANLGNAIAGDSTYLVRNDVCTVEAETHTSTSTQRPDLCQRYPSGRFKPVGALQRHSDQLRIAVFGYLRDNDRARHGGVLRVPMKYLGPLAFDADFNPVSGSNERAEWDPVTGVLVDNPDHAAEGVSGALHYINRFGRLDGYGEYKQLDPLGELYYEALRYLQGQQPTPSAVSGLSSLNTGGFPVFSSWSDPIPQGAETQGPETQRAETKDYACTRSHIVTVADAFNNSDKTVPGNARTAEQDLARAVGRNEPDAVFWTRVVGGFESDTPVAYTDGQGRSQTSGNPNSPANTARWGLEAQAIDSRDSGALGGSYYMAGLAYWANTHAIRPDRPGLRTQTFTIDVNQGGHSDDAAFRRNTPLFLAAKYGGFDDRERDGKPYAGDAGSAGAPDNAKWEAAAGEAKNHLRVAGAKEFLTALRQVFSRVREETGSIAGAAVSAQQVGSAGGAIYQARFDPRSLSGSVLKRAVALDGERTGLVSAATPEWDAGAVLNRKLPASRRIVIGRPADSRAATPFVWEELEPAQQTALDRAPATGATDGLGRARLDYLRGDRSQEQPSGPFRRRKQVLGDIVNAGLVHVGAPRSDIADAGYAAFRNAHRTRTAVIYAGANDGMLHAFRDRDGEELFAYIPGFLVSKLNRLTDPAYAHTAYVDATPAVGEAQLASGWKTVLVSGAGGGGQGVFALDVTDPERFDASQVLWEFTDRDDPDLGHVVGTPQILKLRIDASTTRWFAVVASGVNNHAADGHASATGQPTLFLLDLSKPSDQAWQLGGNFHKIALPLGDATLPAGVVGFSALLGSDGAVQSLYVGDLHGQLWKLDFARRNSTDWHLSGLSLKDTNGAPQPWFVARDDSGKRQPITMRPAVAHGVAGSKIVMIGTGKFLERRDLSSPFQSQSVYALLDDGRHVVSGRSVLQAATMHADGSITAAAFPWGIPTSDTDPRRAGWFFDFPDAASAGERQISDITIDAGTAVFTSLLPTTGGCGDGGGHLYRVDLLHGAGRYTASDVGLPGPPIIVQAGAVSVSASDATGRRTGTRHSVVLTQGTKGWRITDADHRSGRYGRLSWRQVSNYQELKHRP